MRDHDLDQIQSDLDMQLLTQMQIEHDLQMMRGGPTPEEIQASKDASVIVKTIILVLIVGYLLALWWAS